MEASIQKQTDDVLGTTYTVTTGSQENVYNSWADAAAALKAYFGE